MKILNRIKDRFKHFAKATNEFTINNMKYKGSNISMINGTVFVDGKRQESCENSKNYFEVVIKGSIEDVIVSAGTVTIDGDVLGKVEANTVHIQGDHAGDIDCNSAAIGGDSEGDVECNSLIVGRDMIGRRK